MSKELAYILITRMHVKLNKLIQANNYNLLCVEVQHYSRRLDKVLIHYNKILSKRLADNKLKNYTVEDTTFSNLAYTTEP